jgi:hypothetical protein
MTRFTTLAVAALFSTAALAAPSALDAGPQAAPFADAPGERLALRELDADAGIATRRAMRKRARVAGLPLVAHKELNADRVIMMRKMRRIKRNRGVKPLAQ